MRYRIVKINNGGKFHWELESRFMLIFWVMVNKFNTYEDSLAAWEYYFNNRKPQKRTVVYPAKEAILANLNR
jgi:hypothetical protein